RQRENGERERLECGERLRPNKNAMSVPPVDEHAREWRQNERRDLSPESHNPKKKRRVGKTVDEPARRDPRDPRTNQRNALAAEEETIVAVRQRAGQARSSNDCHGRPFRTPPAMVIRVAWASPPAAV